jgi:succinyl-CoA synthetase alpha subunit
MIPLVDIAALPGLAADRGALGVVARSGGCQSVADAR